MNDYICRLVQNMKFKDMDEKYINLCTEYANRLIDNNMPVIFDMIHFQKLIGFKRWYIYEIIKSKERFYNIIKIPKRKTGYRNLTIPVKNLKTIQRWILDNILYNIKISEHSTGFTPHKGIIENARPHVNKEYVIKLDIKNFFDNIDFKRVFRIFNYYGYTNNMSYILTELCTYNGCLPQGAPTSPYLSNIVCLKLDKRFGSLCKKIGANYTRYADDITISGNQSIVGYYKTFIKIISTEGFEVNKDKVKILNGNKKKVVTGIVVNEKLSVDRRIKNNLRQHIYYCKKFGVENHLEHIKCTRSFYKEYLYGIAYFIKSVEEEEGKKFLQDLDDILWEY